MQTETYNYPTTADSAIKQGEVSRKTEIVDKLLHELHEEILGLNGTFQSVLGPGTPSVAQGANDPKPTCATSLGGLLDGFAYRINSSLEAVRSLRQRSEL